VAQGRCDDGGYDKPRKYPGHDPAQGADFMQVTEHLDADGLGQAAHPDRVETSGPDQAGDQVAGRVVVGGVEQYRSLADDLVVTAGAVRPGIPPRKAAPDE
jgi:hypothetical protein